MLHHPSAIVLLKKEPGSACDHATGRSQLECRRAVYEQRLRKIHARLKDGRTQVGLGYDDYSPEELREAAFEHACWIYHDTLAMAGADAPPRSSHPKRASLFSTPTA